MASGSCSGQGLPLRVFECMQRSQPARNAPPPGTAGITSTQSLLPRLRFRIVMRDFIMAAAAVTATQGCNEEDGFIHKQSLNTSKKR
mmetsp:Transcript_19267/g.31803  ORF Transcript_19267/g.31803 Transcript_19267/m.31803 type:complete len:87 (+) Transcript_19267:374-634(+)